MADGKILIIEDEVKIARFIELELKYEGYQTEVIHDGREGLDKALSNKYDLILLDIMLPSLNGMEVLRRIRSSIETPVIMLTAKDETMDKVMGLDLGADDYITKPFAIEELLARIRAALRKQKGACLIGKLLNYKDLTLDLEKYIVTFKGEEIELTKKEFDFLKYMMENKNIVLTREKILENVWGYEFYGDTNIVDVYVRYLRTKIDEKHNVKIIQTVRGVGYVIKDE